MSDRDLKTISYVTRRFNSLQGFRHGVPVGLDFLCCALGIAHGYLGLGVLVGWGLMLGLQRATKDYYAARFGVVVAPPMALPVHAGELAVLGLGIAAPRIRQGPEPWRVMLIQAAIWGAFFVAVAWSLRLHQDLGPLVRLLYVAAATLFFALWWRQGERRVSQLVYVFAAGLCAVFFVRGPVASLGAMGDGGIGGFCEVMGFCWLACGIADHLLLTRVLGRRGVEA